jgi:hypothetical protein
MPRIRTIAAGIAAMTLAGCGGNGAPTAAGSESAAAKTEVAAAGPAGWNAADACSILSKADVGAALKTTVTEASLDLVHQADTTAAATSECTYKLESGGEARLMARWSPINDNNATAIATAKSVSAKSVAAFTSKPIEDVPGVGKAAFLVPGINQFNVFIDDARMIIVTPGNLPDAEAKAAVIALAKKAGA